MYKPTNGTLITNRKPGRSDLRYWSKSAKAPKGWRE